MDKSPLKIIRGALLATISVIGFASTFVAGGVLTKDMQISPAVLSALRFAIAGGTLFLIQLSSPEGRHALFSVPRDEWMRLLWIGPIGTSVMAWCVFMGCARVSSANASMADALSPLAIFIVGAIVSRHATFLQILGLVFGFTGALFVIQVLGPQGLALSAYGIGDAFILACALTWGAYSVFGREPIKRIGAGTFSTWTMLIGCAVFMIMLGAGEVLNAIGAANFNIVWPHGLRAWGLVAFLGVFCTLMPFWGWNAAQKDLPLSVLGMTAYFTPVVAVLLAWIFIGERATSWQWAGTVLICASAVVESGRKH